MEEFNLYISRNPQDMVWNSTIVAVNIVIVKHTRNKRYIDENVSRIYNYVASSGACLGLLGLTGTHTC